MCPKCASMNIAIDDRLTLKMAVCRECGHRWNRETGEAIPTA